ncbi:MAG: transcriptional activator NhaR [Planctomycetaceae bacterium]
MDWLNYHHLLYFWMVAREGSITRACEQLHLAQPTISGQLKKLEQAFGEKLFERIGRELTLTETGQLVYKYADEIFSIGRELIDAVKGRPTGRPLRLRVGVPDFLPKLIVYRLLEPAIQLQEKVQVVCLEDKPDQLLASLALHELDVVLSDSPAGSLVRVKAFNHFLGECGVSFFAAPVLQQKLTSDFPESLQGAPMLLPTDNTTLRISIDRWLLDNDLHPDVVGEFEDTALMKVFGQAGLGVIPAPSAIEHEVFDQYGLEIVAQVPEIKERFYAITVERRLRHPAVVAISENAKNAVFQ